MSEESFAEQMVTKIQELLLESGGLKSITVDGQTVSVADLKKDLEYWEGRVSSEDGTNPSWMTVNMSGGM
jgi:hypothetical protein